jgi:MFS superfamily sulfate permease-like transporter
VLAIANAISGCLGGLPICINLFATYENFVFNTTLGYRGTKLVGLMQVPISYALYSILKWLYEMVPLFVLFVIVALPVIYFLSNMLLIHHRHIFFISCLAALNVLTHPIIALILAAFASVYDIGGLLKATPAEIILENVEPITNRKSDPQPKVEETVPEEIVPIHSTFISNVLPIDSDQPEVLNGSSYILYRFTGAVSYLNFFDHMQEISNLVDRYIKPQKIQLLLSFRYSQIIDEESLE